MSEEVTPKFKMTQEMQEDLQKQIQGWFNEVFKEKYVIIDCPYALALEYGTTPAKSGKSVPQTVTDPETGHKITKTRLEFRDWIAKKESLTGKERAKKGDMIYQKVMSEGMKPHPYIRPAVEDMRRLHIEDVTALSNAPPSAEGDVTAKYAYFLSSRMQYYLHANKDEVSEKLAKSISVAPAMMAVAARNVNIVDLNDSKYNWKPGQARK